MIRKYIVSLAVLLLCLSGVLHAQVIQRTWQGSRGVIQLKDANAAFMRGEYRLAALFLDSLLVSDSSNAVHTYNRGILAEALHERHAIDYFRKAAEMNPSMAHAHWKLGENLLMHAMIYSNLDAAQKVREEAEQHLVKAVELKSGFHQALSSLAYAQLHLGKMEEAKRHAEKAASMEKPTPEAMFQLSEYYRWTGDSASSLEILQSSADRFPHALYLVELISRFQRSEQQDSAVARIRQYLELYPKSDQVPGYLAYLQEHGFSPAELFTGEYQDMAYSEDYQPYNPSELLPLGKRLHYKVKYSFIGLGILDIDVSRGFYKDTPVYKIQYIARTHPGLPFVSIADTFRAYVDTTMRYTRFIEMRTNESSQNVIEVYDNDYDKGKMTNRQIHGDGHWELSTLDLPPNAFDASSILWLTQQFILHNRSGRAVTEISGGYEWSVIHNRGPDRELKVDGEKYPTVKVEGILKYSGIVGMTGAFKGWYLQEKPCWPIIGQFKIFFGHVTVRYDSQEPVPEEALVGW